MSKKLSLAVSLVCLIALASPAAAEKKDKNKADPGPPTILSDASYWDAWLDFHPDQLDPALPQEKLNEYLSERGLERYIEETTTVAAARGIDTKAADFDWRQHMYIIPEPYLSTYSPLSVAVNNEWGMKKDGRLFAAQIPTQTVAPGWMKVNFDTVGWTGRPSPAQMGDNKPYFYWRYHNLKSTTSNIRAAYYRSSFAAAKGQPYELHMTYRGGVRVFINGREVLRRHLPEGSITQQTRAVGYDKAAKLTQHGDFGEYLDRKVKKFAIPQDVLVNGVNVIAIEARAPYMHPEILGMKRRYRWSGGGKKFAVPPAHAAVISLQVKGPKAPAEEGLDVWTVSPQHRLHSMDKAPVRRNIQPLKVVGPRQAIVNGQIALRSSKGAESLKLRVEPLRSTGGQRLAHAVTLRGMHAQPLDDKVMLRMGNHRGLASLGGNHRHPTMLAMWRYRQGGRNHSDKPRGSFFDEIGQAPPTSLEPKQLQPVWVSIAIPADARPDKYTGAVIIEAAGHEPMRVPLVAEVINYTLPKANDFATDVWIEQSPYGIAKTAGVELWSDEHFKLIDASFAHLATLGAEVIHLPVLQFTESGNKEDTPIRWTMNGGKLVGDFTIVDRYLDIAGKHVKPRIISFGIMQAAGVGRGSKIMKNITTIPVGDQTIDLAQQPELYLQVAKQIFDHMTKRGQVDAMHWGFPWDFPPNPELPGKLKEVAPDVGWMRAGHCDQGTPKWVTAQSECWPSWRGRPEGVINVLNPRRHSPFHLLEGHFPPFGFRIFPIRATRNGYTGIGRMGADYGTAWCQGNPARHALPDFGTKNLLWVRDGQVHSSQRLAMLREGLQEDQAYRALQAAAQSGRLRGALAERVQRALDGYISETAHVTVVFWSFNHPAFYDHDQRWQPRSKELFELAAEITRLNLDVTP